MKTLMIGLVVSGILLAGFLTPAVAQNCNSSQSSSGTAVAPNPQICANDLTGGSSLTAAEIFPYLINIILLIMGIAAFIGVVYAGVLYITAGGDAAKAEKARKSLLWSVIGVVVAVLAYAIVAYVIKAAVGLKLP